MFLKQYVKRFKEECWALGFVRGGMHSIMESDHLDVDWVKMPHDRWFADPFVLDVTNEEILLLVEDFGYDIHKGVISLLHINRFSMEIVSRKVLLEKPTHLSFPALWRKEGHIYVYPENAQGGQLDMYEYHPDSETLTFVKTLCEDVVWDSYVTEAFGEPLMFTANSNDFELDIYKQNGTNEQFLPYLQVASDVPNMRMGGGVFLYNNSAYYPAQDNRRTYGGALDIKQINYEKGKFSVEIVKHIESPNKRYPLGIHTLNEYKGVVVIDVKGYRYRKIGELMARLVTILRKVL